MNTQIEVTPASDVEKIASLGRCMTGVIKKKLADKGYGFIQAADGKDYFFHLTDIQAGLEFEEMAEGFQVAFEVKRQPSHDKGGAAQNVRRDTA